MAHGQVLNLIRSAIGRILLYDYRPPFRHAGEQFISGKGMPSVFLIGHATGGITLHAKGRPYDRPEPRPSRTPASTALPNEFAGYCRSCPCLRRRAQLQPLGRAEVRVERKG